MNDTSPEVARLHRRLLLARSNAERLRMGCEMFDTAKSMSLAGLRALGEEKMKERLFLRLYGSEFTPEDRKRIVEWIRRRTG